MSSSHALPRIALTHAPLDTRMPMETPEGIDLILRPAGLVSRSLAFAIDLLIRGVILTVFFYVLSALGDFGMGLFVLALFLLDWGYMVLFEVLNQGRSPGKQIMGLRVVHDDGTPIGWAASLLRNLLRFVDMLPFGYTLGAITCLQHPQFKRLGDVAAGSMVIYREHAIKHPALPDAEPRIAPVALNLEEQRALLAFAERQHGLSPARREELAMIIAEPLHIAPEHAVQHVNGLARGVLEPT